MNTIQDLSQLKGFKLLHLNVRSLPKKIDQIRIMFHEMNLDVITFSETWLNDAVNSKTVALEDYILYRLDRDFRSVKKKRGGGLLTYIHKSHAADCEPLDDYNKSNGDIEAQWSIIHRPHSKIVVVCNIYRPPSGDLVKAISYLEGC